MLAPPPTPKLDVNPMQQLPAQFFSNILESSIEYKEPMYQV